jgi:hypothetical protein
MNYKNIKKRIITATRDITQVIFIDYNIFKKNIQQVFRDIK